MQTATHGACSPERQEVSPPDKSDDETPCAFCSDDADGFDARTGNPVCSRCGHLRADGGGRKSEPQIAVGRRSDGWVALYIAQVPDGFLTHRGCGSTIPDALRELADDVEDIPEDKRGGNGEVNLGP